MRRALMVIAVVLLAIASGRLAFAAPPNNQGYAYPGYGYPGYGQGVPQPMRPSYTPGPYYRPTPAPIYRPARPTTIFNYNPGTTNNSSTAGSTGTTTGTGTTGSTGSTGTNSTTGTNNNNTYPWGYNPAYPYPYGYNYYGSPYYGGGADVSYGAYTGPIFVPADSIFGPGAVQQFMGGGLGVGGGGGGLARSSDFGGSGGSSRPLPASDPKAAPVHNADPDPLATAQRILGLGDSQFANQKYLEAFQRYKRAGEAAPNLAAADFRQAIALIALERYAPALKALKRGLERDPKWPSSGFALDDLYGSNHLDKLAHLERLAKAAEKDTDNTDLLFLVGVCLHFDGSPDRGAVFFQRAAQLAGNAPYLKAFLDAPKPPPRVAHDDVDDPL